MRIFPQENFNSCILLHTYIQISFHDFLHLFYALGKSIIKFSFISCVLFYRYSGKKQGKGEKSYQDIYNFRKTYLALNLLLNTTAYSISV